MWIKTSNGDWICGDKVCEFHSTAYNASGICDLMVAVGDTSIECYEEIAQGNVEEVAYIKEQLATAFIEDNRKVFDVQSELYAFRKEKSDDERSENSD